jgi:hypothetical protein
VEGRRAVGAGTRQGSQPKEEGGRGKKEGKKKEEKEKGNRKKRKIGNMKRKRRKIEKGFRKLGKILGKLGERGKGFLGIILGFSDTVVNSGTAMMARRFGRRDRGGRGIPGVVADSDAGAARGGRRPECVRCRRDSRHARQRGERKGEDNRGVEGGS